MVRAAALALAAFLSGCYHSDTDLIGDNARAITAIDNIIITPLRQAYYIQGAGYQVQACYLQERKHMVKCQVAALLKLERTQRGNYIVQSFQNRRYHFGLWFRSERSERARAGAQCFVWLGEDYISTPVPGMVLPSPNMRAKLDIAAKAQVVAPFPIINRTALLALVDLYERELSPFTQDGVTCINERLMLDPARMQIAGDNRHLRDIE